MSPVNHIVWSPEGVPELGNTVRVANQITILPSPNRDVLWLDNLTLE